MASPWGKIETAQPVDLQEIMSEEYAKDLQNKEIDKYTQKVHNEIQNKKTTIIPTGVEVNEIIVKEEPAQNTTQNKNIDEIPQEILDALERDNVSSEVCSSDELIARMLQSQFDHEYNEDLKRIEKSRNKQSKVSISLQNYKRGEEIVSDNDSDDYEEDVYTSEKKDWDRFETNEKIFKSIPQCGFKKNEKDGTFITKHDPDICNTRNACKVMSFPPEIPTGDGAGFDMKLSNQVYNQLKSYTRQKKTNKKTDRSGKIATAEMAIDEGTRLLLFKLINNQILEQVNGIISTGKEALILHANSDPNYEGDLKLPKECAIKVFKTTLNEFKQRDLYIKDDYRFKERFKKTNNRVLINMWAEKEVHNLMKMQKFGINCPTIVTLKKNVLVMSFIGDNHNAAKKLKEARLSDAQLSCAYEEIIDIMCKLYNDVKLIHGDLSEYNILWYDEKCWIIDVAQSIAPEHPSALEFLMRDCNNIVSFFRKRQLPNILSKEELFEKITSLNAEVFNAGMLEKIHSRGANVFQATAPETDDCPEEKKPLEYPFDLAWEKSMQIKNEKTLLNEAIENIEALQVIEPVEFI